MGNFEEYVSDKKDLIYNKIIEYIPKHLPSEFSEMVRAYVDRRGKYARPTILILWAELHGANPKDALMAAATMQCSEDWILMHDDFQDGNTLRRGKPTAHILYTPRHAINAGDYLHMVNWGLAHDTTKELRTKFGEQRAESYFQHFLTMLLTTAEGQYYDMHLTHDVKDITKFTLDDYYQSIHAKTACYSVYGPMQMGSIIAGKNEPYLSKIKNYGVPIGNAFQLKDDVLDCTSTPEVLGKAIGNDVLEGVKTPILLHAVKNSKPADLKKLKKIYAKEHDDITQDEVNWTLDHFKKTGAITYAESLIDDLAKKAMENFEKETKAIPESDIKETARNTIEKMVKRKK